jgi:hypothetical protein
MEKRGLVKAFKSPTRRLILFVLLAFGFGVRVIAQPVPADTRPSKPIPQMTPDYGRTVAPPMSPKYRRNQPVQMASDDDQSPQQGHLSAPIRKSI